MNLTLCGLSIPFEEYTLHPVASERIHQNANYFKDLSNRQNVDVLIKCLDIITDGKGILRAVSAEIPRDINHQPINRMIVKKELLILATDVKRISAAVNERYNIGIDKDKKINYCNQLYSFSEQCAKIENLAHQMIVKSINYDDQAELIMLLGTADKKSILSVIPRDVIYLILNMSIQVKLSRADQDSIINK